MSHGAPQQLRAAGHDIRKQLTQTVLLPEITGFMLGVSPRQSGWVAANLGEVGAFFGLKKDADASVRHFRFRAVVNFSVIKIKVFSIFITQNEISLFSAFGWLRPFPADYVLAEGCGQGRRKPFCHLIKPLALPMKLSWQMRSLLHFSRLLANVAPESGSEH